MKGKDIWLWRDGRTEMKYANIGFKYEEGRAGHGDGEGYEKVNHTPGTHDTYPTQPNP